MEFPYRSLSEVKSLFDAHGETVTGWAELNGFRKENVYAVLAGRSKGRRGEAHRIAVALGLKKGSRSLSGLGTSEAAGAELSGSPLSTRGHVLDSERPINERDVKANKEGLT